MMRRLLFRLGSTRIYSGDLLQVCSPYTNLWETLGTLTVRLDLHGIIAVLDAYPTDELRIVRGNRVVTHHYPRACNVN